MGWRGRCSHGAVFPTEACSELVQKTDVIFLQNNAMNKVLKKEKNQQHTKQAFHVFFFSHRQGYIFRFSSLESLQLSCGMILLPVGLKAALLSSPLPAQGHINGSGCWESRRVTSYSLEVLTI